MKKLDQEGKRGETREEAVDEDFKDSTALVRRLCMRVWKRGMNWCSCFKKGVKMDEIDVDSLKLTPTREQIAAFVDIETFKRHTEQLHESSNGFLMEYQAVRRKVVDGPGYFQRIMSGQQERERNRYADIVCLCDRRVKLKSSDQDYINASVIHTESEYTFSGELDSDTEFDFPPQYIAAQAPLPHTIADFWRMCVDYEIPVIAMLTPWKEEAGGRVRIKAEPYFPEAVGETQEYAPFSVTCRQLEDSEKPRGIVVRKLELEDESTGQKRQLFHVHFTHWPDFGCVQNFGLYLNVHSVISKCMQRMTHESEQHQPRPLLVHCSAGVGRTGTYIAIDVILKWIRETVAQEPQDKQQISVADVVANLRNQRPGMVVTLEQYVMVYQVIYFVLFGTEVSCTSESSSKSVANMEDAEIYRHNLGNT